MHFVINKSFDIGQKQLDEGKVREVFYQSLTTFCTRCNVWENEFRGSLSNFFEHGAIESTIDFSIKKQKLFIEIKGDSRLSKFTYVAFFTGWLLSSFWLGKVLTGMFLFNLITSFLSRKLPKKYFEEAIESLMFKIEQSPEDFMPNPIPSSNEKAETKSLPPPLPVAAEVESQ
jgi:hypothetical protein